MKRYTDPIVILSLLLVLCCATACTAQECPKPCGCQTYCMERGWYVGGPAWYVELATSNISFAYYLGIPLVPKLASATAEAGGGADLYWVTNANNFGPVLTTAPGLAAYSGLWDVQFVTWKPGVTPWVITRTDIVGSSPGLPDGTQADFVDSNIILDLPIVALGPLGGPWYPAPPGTYRIKQGRALCDYARTKLIDLPTFEVFCKSKVHRYVSTERVIITDVSLPDLATCLGANLAPALANVDAANRQAFWYIVGGPYVCQKPVLEHCLDCVGVWDPNHDYSPVMDFLILERSLSLPPWTVVNNPDFVQYLLTAGLLTQLVDTTVINANEVAVRS